MFNVYFAAAADCCRLLNKCFGNFTMSDYLSLDEINQEWRERVIGAVAYFQGGENAAEVEEALMNLDVTLWAKKKRGNNLMRFCRDWASRVLLTGSVADAHRSGRPRKVPQSDAKKAAEILMHGMPANIIVEDEDGNKHMELTQERFTSMKQAYSVSQELQDICHQCGVTPEQLLTAAYDAEPNLTRRSLGFKHLRTDQNKEARRTISNALESLLLSSQAAEPGNKDAMLDRVVHVDEATIYLANLDAKSLHVFCNKNDISVHNVVHCPGLGKDKKMKLHFIAAVSLKHGPLYFNFTSGTREGKLLFNGMKRDDWKRQPQDPAGLNDFHFPAAYTVSS